MFKKNSNYIVRKIHRYFGVFIGIQFLFWTIGGLYFSWNNMDNVHGKELIKHSHSYYSTVNFKMAQRGLDSLRVRQQVDSVKSIKLITLFERTTLQLNYFQGSILKTQLIDLESGILRNPLTKDECLQLAIQSLNSPIDIEKFQYIDQKNCNNFLEYRNKPLPAYAFSLKHPTKTTIYVAPNLGEITTVRNNNWRRFDFLWMLHTMDYSTRDTITNYTLRIFSVLGLITIISGFLLFYKTSPTLRKLKKKG